MDPAMSRFPYYLHIFSPKTDHVFRISCRFFPTKMEDFFRNQTFLEQVLVPILVPKVVPKLEPVFKNFLKIEGGSRQFHCLWFQIWNQNWFQIWNQIWYQKKSKSEHFLVQGDSASRMATSCAHPSESLSN